MDELFVPFHIAKMLKERGFNDICFKHWYAKDNTTEPILTYTAYNNELFELDFNIPLETNEIQISAPLYQQVIDWFEKKETYIYALRYNNTWQWKRDVCGSYDDYSKGDGFVSKYAALNAAFEAALF